MQEKMRFDTHLENTNIPATIEELVDTSGALLAHASEHADHHLRTYSKSYDAESAIWKRYDETDQLSFINLGVHALKNGSTIIAFDNHRSLDHRFPEPPVDMNEIVHDKPYDHAAISIFPLEGRILPVLYLETERKIPAQPLYPSSLNEGENEYTAKRFEVALDQFYESFLLNVSLLGLSEAVHEKRSTSATLASAA